MIIPTEPIKEKLRKLQGYMPGMDETTYEFGKLLADQLNPQVLPLGFKNCAELLLYGLKTGVDGYTRQPIKGKLVGCPEQVYKFLSMMIPDIAEAVCPKEFADEVKKYCEKAEEVIRK
jgi:hypothetical protein